MASPSQDFRDLLELRKVASLSRGEEMESVEEWNHVLQNRSQVVNLVVPDPVLALAHRATLEVALEQRKDHWIPLRDVEAQRDFPRALVVFAGPEGNVEAPLGIGEASQVPRDLGRDLMDVQHRHLPEGQEPFLLMVRTRQIFTATLFARFGRASGEYCGPKDFPAYSRIC
jgi:hypothetical protein